MSRLYVWIEDRLGGDGFAAGLIVVTVAGLLAQEFFLTR